MRILVTGGTGFLGVHLCRRLLADGHKVTVLRRLSSDVSSIDDSRLDQRIGDVTDLESIYEAVAGHQLVVHAAASTGHFGVAREAQHLVNVDGTRNVAEACRLNGVVRLLHVSSVAAVGIPTDPARPANEDTAFNLDGSGLTYHCSKRRAEAEVLGQIEQGLDAVIVNPAQIFGPDRGIYQGAQALSGAVRRWVIPQGPGGQCIVHVLDVVDGIVRAIEHGASGERYILGGDNISFRKMSQSVCRSLGIHRLHLPISSFVAERGNRAKNWMSRMLGRDPLPTYDTRFCHQFYESAKAKVKLGYNPRPFGAIVDEWIQHLMQRSNKAAMNRGEGQVRIEECLSAGSMRVKTQERVFSNREEI